MMATMSGDITTPPPAPDGYTYHYGKLIPKPPPPPPDPPGGLAFMMLEAHGIPIDQPESIKSDTIYGGFSLPRLSWRYVAALWIAIDVFMTALALYYAVTHGARPF